MRLMIHPIRVAAVLAVSLGLLACANTAYAQDSHLARNLAATCTNCHGITGQALSDMRPLAGIPADRMLGMMADFKSGAQPATVMHQIARGYSDGQLQMIAGYFSAQAPRK